jgi:tetratricopeptide (TPR) repeat protein
MNQPTPEPVLAATKGLSLTRLDAMLTTLRTMMVNIGFFGAMVMLVPAFGAQVLRNPVIIEPIAVPEALADRGLTATVAANRVWDGLQDFTRSADLARQTLVAVPDSQLGEFTLPGSTLSIDAVFRQLRQFVGVQETRITGEIICQTSDCAPEGQRLRLRIVGNEAEIIDMPPMGTTPPALYFREAAGAVFDVLDPLVAAAARSISDPEGAAARAQRIAAVGGPDTAWAEALLGDIALAGGDVTGARTRYEAALLHDAALNQARLGLARAALAAGELESAEATLANLSATGDLAVETLLLRSDIALARGDLAGAERTARDAAEADAVSPQPLIRLARVARLRGDVDAAKASFAEALAIEPGAPEALEPLGDLYRAEGNLASVETIISDWAEFAPESAAALLALVRIRVERADLPGAADAYARLAALAPLTLEQSLDHAGIVARIGRYAQAADILLPFVEANPARPEAVMALARLHEEAGRHDKALSLYERYLQLGPDMPDQAEAENAIARLGT